MTNSKLILKRLSYAVNIIWYLEMAAGVTFLYLFIASSNIRKQFLVMFPVHFSQTNIRMLKSANANFGDARLDSYSGFLVFHLKSSWQNLLVMVLAYLLLFSVVIFITYKIKQIFDNFTNNNHFIKHNIIHLKTITIVIIIVPIIEFLLELFANRMFQSNLKMGSLMELCPVFNYGMLIMGIFLLSLIEIFKLANDLDEESKLTV